jgi:hypothetical protein
MTDQNCPFDVAVDFGRLIRIQVKSARWPQRRAHEPAYQFGIARAGYRAYAKGEFELLALVALDARLIAYVLPSPDMRGVVLRASSGKRFADYPFDKALAELGL